MSRNILYIINPISGTKRKSDLHRLVEEKTLQQQIPFEIIPSVADGNYSDIRSRIQSEKITDVVIAGGDGTVNQVVGNLKDEDVNFGIIPCGSGNGLALAAKISTNPEKALETIFHGKPKFIDAFHINGHFACMLSGLGFDAKVAHEFADVPKRGLLTYIKLSLKNFFSMKAFPLSLSLDESRFETEAYFISVANSNQFGNHFTIAPKASLSDGLLDVIIVTDQSKMSAVINLLNQLAGWNKLQHLSQTMKKKGVIYFQTSQLTIHNPEKAPLHIDGEPVETSQRIDISVIKNCFRLIQPA